MPAKRTKATKAATPGSTGKRTGKTPAKYSPAWAKQVGQNRDDASRRAGRRTGVNYD